MMLEVESKQYIKSIDLGHSVAHLRSDGIIQVNFGDDVELDAKETMEIIAASGELSGGKKALVLNVAGKNTSATSGAREESASAEGCRFTIADAFVTKSLAQKLLGNFYLNFHKPGVPTKIFNNEEEAVAWLKAQL
jgi:hypothetical protein